ncbi:MAG: AGCS family alanine or glycine:cation symporter [Arenicella sp.]|jgi:AGCS family alanine or glycine:cation symporter
MESIVNSINNVVWGTWGLSVFPVLVVLCLLAGLFYTIQTRFVQVRLFSEMIHLLKSNKSSAQGISSFQALTVSLSGRVGTGNIAGVATAIGFGGPGAIFWMWVVAILGAATAYIEATLGQIYKETDIETGEYRGGPAFYIEKAMGQKWYAWVFAIATIIACGLLLPTVQSNAIGGAIAQTIGEGTQIETSLGVFSSTKIITGLVIVTMFGFIIFGGVKRIANFAQVVVPFMALAYILTALTIIALNIDQLPRIIGMIVGDAFTPMAGLGAAIGLGVKRGVYSNEAGQGTAPHAAAAAEVDHPAQQGLVQSFSIYIDTLFICTATALMILITGMFNVGSAEAGFYVQNIAAEISAEGPAFTQMAIESVMPGIGNPFIAIALFFFSFTTLLAYYYIAESNVAYIRRSIKIPGATFILKLVLISAVFFGTIIQAKIVWDLGDIGLGIMAWVNIIGILIIFFMGRPAMKALKDYEQQKAAGVEKYTFDPKKLGIKNAHFWENKT